jgi:hypothetical protein
MWRFVLNTEMQFLSFLASHVFKPVSVSIHNNPHLEGKRISFNKLAVDTNCRETSSYRRLYLMPDCEYEIIGDLY